jgi:hypothetical protein
VQYARSGAFTINLWFKPGNMSGEPVARPVRDDWQRGKNTQAPNSSCRKKFVARG